MRTMNTMRTVDRYQLYQTVTNILSSPEINTDDLRIYENVNAQNFLLWNKKEQKYIPYGRRKLIVPLLVCKGNKIIFTISEKGDEEKHQLHSRFPLKGVINTYFDFNSKSMEPYTVITLLKGILNSSADFSHYPILETSMHPFVQGKKFHKEEEFYDFLTEQYAVEAYKGVEENVKTRYYPTAYGTDIGILKAYEYDKNKNRIIEKLFFLEKSLDKVKEIVEWSEQKGLWLRTNKKLSLNQRIENAENLIACKGRETIKDFEKFAAIKLVDYMSENPTELEQIQKFLGLMEEQLQEITFVETAKKFKIAVDNHVDEVYFYISLLEIPINNYFL